MSMMQHLSAMQVVVPLLTAPIVALIRPHGLAWAATTAASLMAFAIALSLMLGVNAGNNFTYSMGSWPAPYGIELGIDSFSALLLLIITGASSMALLGGRLSLNTQIEAHRQPLFYAAWLLALSGLVGIVVTADAFNIFVFMEISSLASYILIAGGPDRRALPAVFKYLAMGTIGATFYLIGIGMIYMMTGTLNLADMAARIQDVGDKSPVLVAAGFISVGLALKAAVFPLHAWLPNSYTHAPHAVTVFLAACATKMSLYVLFRFDFFVFQQNLDGHFVHFSTLFMPMAVLAILVASTYAVYERNLKRLLAFSSVAQIGYIVLGASLISVAGLSASGLHMFNHALAKGALFLAVSGLAYRFSSLELEDIAGAARSMPFTMAAFAIAGLSLIGVPGTAGFISKWYLITAVLQKGVLGIALTAIIVISSLLAVVYIWRVIEAAYFRQPKDSTVNLSEAPTALLITTWVAALANIYFGLDSSLSVTLASNAAELLVGTTGGAQ